MTRAAWSLLAEGLGRERLAGAWEAALGREVVADLVEAGVLSALPARAGGSWPCVENVTGGCARRVVGRGDELRAVCGRAPASCSAERLGPEARLLVVDRAVLLAKLATGLGLEARVEDRDGPAPVLLGEGRIADASIRYLWLDRPRWAGLGAELFRVASGSGLAALVLVVAHPSQVPAERERAIAGVRVFWMALAEAASWEDRRLRVDLSEVILGLDLSVDLGPLLWPRYALVIDQRREQVWYGGRLIRPTGMAARFLELLAARPGEVVTRREVILALWGDQIKRGQEPVFERYDQRLRQIRSELGQVFRASDPPMSLPKDPVELVRGEDDLRAGYRIAVERGLKLNVVRS